MIPLHPQFERLFRFRLMAILMRQPAAIRGREIYRKWWQNYCFYQEQQARMKTR
jgi:hypothetical protein